MLGGRQCIQRESAEISPRSASRFIFGWISIRCFEIRDGGRTRLASGICAKKVSIRIGRLGLAQITY
ncbi:MAG: hypothetical protein IPO77_15800 [Acidobacteria bacterium]|nr:hypothetical protein [Acidobacteriota bacterium]